MGNKSCFLQNYMEAKLFYFSHKNIICSIHFAVPTKIFRIINGKVLATIITKHCYGNIKKFNSSPNRLIYVLAGINLRTK